MLGKCDNLWKLFAKYLHEAGTQWMFPYWYNNISTLPRAIMKGMLSWKPFLELPTFIGVLSLAGLSIINNIFLIFPPVLKNTCKKITYFSEKPLTIQEWNPSVSMVMCLLLITFTCVMSCDALQWLDFRPILSHLYLHFKITLCINFLPYF